MISRSLCCRTSRFALMPLVLLALIGLALFLRPSFAQSHWAIEAVDDGQGTDVGMFSAMAIDAGGNFHIAYFNATTRNLQYAYRGKQDQKWSKMIVEPNAGLFTSLAVDKHGFAHIAYDAPSRTGLHYAYWDGKQWQVHVIDQVQTEFSTSLQLDSAGNPRVAYFQLVKLAKSGGQRLKYAYFDGKDWFIKTVALRPRQGVYNSLALDSTDHSHIAFAESGHIQYATWDNTQWQYEIVDITSDADDKAGLGTTMALDAAGNPQVAYFDPDKRKLKYAYKDAGAWKTEIVEDLSGTPKYPDSASLKIDAHNHPHIAYYDSGSGVLKYAVRENAKWTVEVVDRQGDVGMYNSLCLDASGQPYISYYDSTAKQLRLAHIGPETPAPTKGTKP
jgi:hypothetical protein